VPNLAIAFLLFSSNVIDRTGIAQEHGLPTVFAVVLILAGLQLLALGLPENSASRARNNIDCWQPARRPRP
jgi:hypothetical protein